MVCQNFPILLRWRFHSIPGWLLTFHTRPLSIFILVYVDDIIIAGTDDNYITSLKSRLEQLFSIKDLGLLQYFLGIEISYSSQGIFLCQRKYIHDILEDFNLTNVKSSSFLMEQHLKLIPIYGNPLSDSTLYHCLIGLYLTATRPDISFSVNYLSQFIQHLWLTHLDVVLCIFCYLKWSIDHAIIYPHQVPFLLKVSLT